MKKILYSLLIASAALCFFSCSSPSGAEKAAIKAVEALQNEDYDAYAATFDLSPSDQKILAGMVEEKGKEELSKKGGIASYKIVDSTEEDDKATVNVLVRYKDGSEETEKMTFVKKDGEWLQQMDK